MPDKENKSIQGQNQEKKKAPLRNKLIPRLRKEKEASFYIVGIGTSAGGLEGIEQFFINMPANSGLAFVLVPHLDPTHISILPDLIQKYTEMRVIRIKDGMKVEPNCVYVIPPNKDMAILHGVLQLIDPIKTTGPRLPIDYFFRSLAVDQQEKSIGIILSGMGTDGTLGLRAIKGELGMAMVSDPQSAKYDSMPRSAIETGLIDYILAPKDMPKQLIAYTKYAIDHKVPSKIIPVEGKVPDALQKIFILLRSHTGHDFSSYKHNTICRRIERRMNVHQIEHILDYVRYLQENPSEIENRLRKLRN